MAKTTTFPTTETFAAANEATERVTEQVRQFGEQAAAAGRGFGHLALSTYEQAVTNLVEFERKAAEAAPVDWVKTAIDAHASLVKDINNAYVKAVRVALD
jgi:hypothetical protein